ncbi:MAG: hypothetical protein AVO33_01420 [delta proteobacterium ML8_F1]|nr:MAG: hypothetical protein AVO33_01420 [delta proteobacterium ML8_F1]
MAGTKIKWGLLLLAFVMLLSACGSGTKEDSGGSGPGDPGVRLLITRDYGEEVIVDRLLPVEAGWRVYDALLSAVDVGTAYGGGFISAIEGLESTGAGPDGKRWDWFYHINGIAADVGAMDYELSDGDFIWWDYHPWSLKSQVNGAVTGMYPEVFTRGYREPPEQVLIVHTTDTDSLARDLEKYLQEDQGIRAETSFLHELDEDLILARESPVLVLGEWHHLAQVSMLRRLNEDHDRSGAYVFYDEEGLWLFDYEGRGLSLGKGSHGSITAYGEGLGDSNPLWLITGTDHQGVASAVARLAAGGGSIRDTYGVALVADEVYRLPLQPGE